MARWPVMPFQVPLAAAGAVLLLGIERDHGVSALPRSVGIRESSEADAVADCPHAHQPIQLSAGGGHARSYCVGVVQDAHVVIQSRVQPGRS